MTERQNRIVGIVGRKGSGKSTRLSTYLKYMPRFLIFDSMADHIAEVPNTFYGDVDSALDFLDWSRTQQSFAASFVPSANLEEEFDEIAEAVYRRGDLAFVVEEIPMVVKPAYLPRAFGYMVRTGRHRAVDIVWTAQRASEVSRTLTSATDIFVLFSQTEPRDLDALAERCGRETAQKVADLGVHSYFVWDVVERKIIPDSPRLLKREVAQTA